MPACLINWDSATHWRVVPFPVPDAAQSWPGYLGFFEFRRQLEYKAKIYGTNLIIADRFFPSSKTCSSCGEIKEDLALANRVFCCRGCGLEIERDCNAALNLRTLGLRGIHACGPEGSGSFSERAKPRRVEAGTNQCSPVGTK